MFSIDTVRFKVMFPISSEHYWRTDITETRTIMALSILMLSIAPVSNSDYNKTDGH